jgi:outer membrane lipoprotein-sorting protein
MLKRFLGVALAVAWVSAVGASQSVDELVAKNLEAKGGLKRLLAIQTIKQTSKMTMQGMEASVTFYNKRPNMVRQEIQVKGELVVNAFDGITPWIINPATGTTRPIAISGPQAETIREQSHIDGPLVDYKARGYLLDLVGRESLDQARVFHLRLTSPGRQVTHVYLDETTGLELKLAADVGKVKLEQTFADYRPVDGIQVAHLLRTFTNGIQQNEIRVETVEFNIRVDDVLFRMPK